MNRKIVGLRSLVMNDDIVKKIDEKFRENCRLSQPFPQISRTILYEVVMEKSDH